VSIPKNAPLVYVSFSADINQNTNEKLIDVMASCANSQVEQVCLLLSTIGGSVMNGLNLYNVLISMPFELTTHNVGTVNSVGNMLFLAGNERYAVPSATFMFHGVGFTFSQGQRLEEKDIREKLAGILRDQKRIGDIISQHTKLGESEIEGLFTEAQIKDASFALEKGIVHEIREVQIPRGTPIVPLVFNR
jgi:ATP-dependent Clp protease protease subunit